MNNRWRRITKLDDLSYACTVSKTDYSIMVFNSVWDKGGFCVDDGSGVFDELARSNEESTIIGNIHENPELLEE